ncbi:MAG: peptidyl-prolyl cis-trans isomerase, partial [Pirellulales bacterium]|nr:peptidyl-prolyl cis-trans isomerase [Pirellulales bacterium]
GSDFAEVAKEHSDCPSGQQGGALGEFSPGQMVPEFDQVVFSAEVNQVHGPVQTQFGYHLIEITDRTD